jgi:hypothetical protein
LYNSENLGENMFRSSSEKSCLEVIENFEIKTHMHALAVVLQHVNES